MTSSNHSPTVFITGAAQRIGASIASRFHQAGCNLVIHYRQSDVAAKQLAEALNQLRPGSTKLVNGALDSAAEINAIAEQALQAYGRLDILINNASSFYPSDIGQVDEAHWNDLMAPNLKAPFFLAQALNASLQKTQGCIINVIDIHGLRPLSKHPVYCAAKAGLAMLTQSLAKELSPAVRVNGIAPGAILWPQQAAELSDEQKQKILAKVPLQRSGKPEDIADTALFLSQQNYITGQIIAVDGGRSLHT